MVVERLDIPDSVCENIHQVSQIIKTNRTLSVLDFLRRIKKENWYSIDALLYYAEQPSFNEAYEDWLNRTGNKRDIPFDGRQAGEDLLDDVSDLGWA
jgi:hypothetical protein